MGQRYGRTRVREVKKERVAVEKGEAKTLTRTGSSKWKGYKRWRKVVTE